MATDFKYASQSDLEMYYPNFSQYDAKRQILGWETTGTSNFYKAYNTGLITNLFFDGIEGTAVTDDPNANYEFRYSSGNDSVEVFIDTANPIDLLIEGGIDNATYFDQMLVNASMELNNLLDGRYATPLPKITQIDENTVSVSQAKEYDAIVIKMTCYLCVANILRAENQTEEADYYYSQVTNPERTGIADRLNAGEFKLSYEVDAKDKQGRVTYKSVSGSMDIVEVAGVYVGEKYDLLKIECTVSGAYGVAKAKVHYYADNKLFGAESAEKIVTGGLQTLQGMGGLLVRFQGASMTDGDIWEIEVTSAEREISNAQTTAINLTRRGYGY
tara:strand:+ start:1427 stop:2416 length:990 start_codon:yes stop_codon:yes gene_type:complete